MISAFMDKAGHLKEQLDKQVEMLMNQKETNQL